MVPRGEVGIIVAPAAASRTAPRRRGLNPPSGPGRPRTPARSLFDISQPTLSHHLRKLREADIFDSGVVLLTYLPAS
ncbi:MAG TPA: ArsR family transcriptional regulator [Conexibacter sp.]|nr:ArsR family transcriptional regulator [Conexibacter sp.]